MRKTACLVGLVLLFAPAVTLAQEDPNVPPAPSVTSVKETYRLRVENALYGRVEISLDSGIHYTVLGRVVHPATLSLVDKTAMQAGAVLRGGSFGLAFAIAPGECLKLLPAPPAPTVKPGKTVKTTSSRPPAFEASAIGTNLAVNQGIFGDLLPTVGSTVQVASGLRSPATFWRDYAPSQEDSFLIQVQLPIPPQAPNAPAQTEGDRASAWRETIRKRVETAANAYAAGALARAQAENRRVVSGVVTLRPKLPAGEPDPITAVSFAVDNDIVADRTIAPFTYEWDTHHVPDGEHLVEVRALNRSGNTITRVRTLVVVHNTPGT